MNLKKYAKELKAAGYLVSKDMVTNMRGDVVGQMDPYGKFHYSDNAMALVICKAMRDEVVEKPVSTPKKAKKTKRARDEDGQFVADDPTTPDVNEAWED